jgi:RNA polymerase sigma-70 factor (ECF subfamily)
VINDSPSTELGLIAALHAVRETQEARKRLDRLSVEIVNSYQPYWAVRAEVYRTLGEIDEARTAYERAIALSQSAAIRRFLRRQMEER